MEARLEKRLQDFQNYKPEEVSKIENGKVVVQQQYVILVISNKADDIINAMRGYCVKREQSMEKEE